MDGRVGCETDLDLFFFFMQAPFLAVEPNGRGRVRYETRVGVSLYFT